MRILKELQAHFVDVRILQGLRVYFSDWAKNCGDMEWLGLRLFSVRGGKGLTDEA
ncbi:MAG: hypothetical protein PVS2B2_27900 [Candidatus Acidiferrum sp.]